MKVSVIIPVYNAASFVRKAVESALIQEETTEVLLIEDCSTDTSLNICKELEHEFEKVILLRHSDGKNHGAGASRNLGIERSSCEFVAFLDADDYYLPGRFTKDKEILINNPSIDGVYNALGSFYYSDNPEVKLNFQHRELTTVKEKIPPERLFEEANPFGKKGYFSLDTLTVRKKVFKKIGYFHPGLKVTQDTHFRIRLMALCLLAPGSIDEVVAIRGIHESNRSQIKNIQQYHSLLHKSLFDWAVEYKIPHSRVVKIWEKYLSQNNSEIYQNPLIKRRWLQLTFLAKSINKYPKIIFPILSHYLNVNKEKV